MEQLCSKNKSRKYNSLFRKKLVSKFDTIKNKSDLINIYNIIYNDIGNNISTNRNGIFINMNLLSDNCIDKLVQFIDEINNITITQSDTDKINYKTYKSDDVEKITELGHKLSNQEKNFIKRFRNQK
jgi:hypothetical protein